MSEQQISLSPEEYSALALFLLHAKDEKDLGEVADKFEPHLLEWVRAAVKKIEGVLDVESN